MAALMHDVMGVGDALQPDAPAILIGHWAPAWKGDRIDQPALFIAGTRDPAAFGFGAYSDPDTVTDPHVPLIEGHTLEGCGDRTQEERSDAVNRLLLDWLARLPSSALQG